MICKNINWFNKNCILVCDGKCEKAWGINNRPQIKLSNGDDDYEYKSDNELGLAPIDPGTYEGGYAKPQSSIMNKWCSRECERSEIVKDNERFELPDFSKRIKNIPD